MRKVTALVVVAAMLSILAPPAGAEGDHPDWDGWLSRLWQWMDQAVQAIDRLRSVIARSTEAWWEFAAEQIASALRVDDAGRTLQHLLALAGRLPGGVGGWFSSLYQQVLAMARSEPSPDSPDGTYRRVVELNPTLRRAERRSLERQVQTLRLAAESEAVQRASESVAQHVVSSTVARDVASLALGSADNLRRSVGDAQSSRAILQYLGEGIADLMGQQAMSGAEIAQNLAALSQQQALTNRELQLVVTALAQQLLSEERDRRARALATQEAMRSVAEGYAASMTSVGASLVDLQRTASDRRRRMEDAITPR